MPIDLSEHMRLRSALVLAMVCIGLFVGGCAIDATALVVDVADAAGQSILNSLLDTLSAQLAGA